MGRPKTKLSRSAIAEGYVGTLDAAAILRVSVSTVQKMVKAGTLKAWRTQGGHRRVSLGVSAIGRVGATHAQNAKTLDAYYHAIHEGRFATVRGLQLDADDLLRRKVIMDLMCRGRLDVAEVQAEFGVDVTSAFSAEL